MPNIYTYLDYAIKKLDVLTTGGANETLGHLERHLLGHALGCPTVKLQKQLDTVQESEGRKYSTGNKVQTDLLCLT